MLSPAELAAMPCRQNEPELWFSSIRADQAKAKRLCRSCFRIEACLAETLETERHLGHALQGVHAGTTKTERQRVLQRSA
jgi:hypothetical protein